MKTSIAIVAITGLAGAASADIVVNGAVETFDDSSAISASDGFFSDGGGDFFTNTADNSFGSFVEYNGADGDYFAAMDINGEGGPDTQILSFNTVNITGFTGLELSVDLAEDDDGTNEDWDTSDFVDIQASIDGGSFFNILELESVGDGDPFNTAPAVDTTGDGFGDGTVITDTFSSFTAAIAGSGSTLDLQVVISLDSGDEDIAIDNVGVTGVPTPGSLALLGMGGLVAARRRR